MTLFDTFSKKAPGIVFLSIVLGALAGASYALLIPILLNSVAHEAAGFQNVESAAEVYLGIEVSEARFALIYLAICALILVAQTFSQAMLSRVSLDVTMDLRVKLYERVSRAPIAALEKIGPSRIIATLTADVQRIVSGGRVLPDILVNAVTLFAMLFSLFLLNAQVFWFVLKGIGFGVITYQIPMYFGNKYFIQSRQKLDGLHESIRGLIYGAKELKLNKQRRESFFAELLLANERDVIKYDKRGFTIVTVAQNYGNLLSFLIIGAVAYIFVNYHSVTRQELTGVIMTMLYVIGPVAILLNFIPQLVLARVSINRVRALFDEMPEESATDAVTDVAPWQVMQFVGVEFRYKARDGSDAFQLGPIDLSINKGEVTFIVGGNGSGKSTLSKLITLHYSPSAGTLRFDDVAVDGSNLSSYRQSISAIYSDYYLFDRLLGLDGKADIAAAQAYLKALDLDKKVSISDGKFSTLSLSDGQKRRLALLVAFLEDKDLYLFDEWAADQDPTFKNIFYRTILPDLKRRGKAVVVISHDDRYFDAADLIVVMEEGRVARVERNTIDVSLPMNTARFLAEDFDQLAATSEP